MTQSSVPPPRVLAYLARRLHQICLRILAEIPEFDELTPIGYAALAALNDDPGIDQRGLAERLAVDPVTTANLIADLEGMGLVRRHIDPSDRRARLLHLTPRGSRLRARLRPIGLAANDRILAPLSPEERVMFLNLLTRVIEANKVYTRPGNRRQPPRRPQGAK